MTSPEDRPAATDVPARLLATFLAAPNDYRLPAESCADEADATIVKALDPLLQDLRAGRTDVPVLLPRRCAGEELTTWYACVTGDTRSRALADELQAFVGPSFAALPATWHTLDTGDPLEAALAGMYPSRVLRMCARDSRGPEIVRLWSICQDLLARRPRAGADVPLSFEQMRARFDRALAARDEEAARMALGTLRERHCLSAENQLFLEIRLLAALGRWDGIAGHRRLSSLLEQRLPAETYGDLMEALYETALAPVEVSGTTADTMLDVFRQTLAADAAPLFRTRGRSRRPAVLKAFLLHELSQPRPDPGIAGSLLGQLPAGAFGRVDAALRSRVEGLRTPDPRSEAAAAYDAEAFDRAYDLYRSLPDSHEVLTRLVCCAREMEDPERAAAVMARLDAASGELAAAVRAGMPWRLEKVQALAAGRPAAGPARWAEVIDWLPGGTETAADYVERWREGARSWDAASMAGEINFGPAAADVLTRLSVEHPAVAEQVLPLWVELFVGRGSPDTRLAGLYAELFEALRAWQEVPGDGCLGLMRDVLAFSVAAGLDAGAYAPLVDGVTALAEQGRSPRMLAWAMEVCDILAMSPCPVPDARTRLLVVTLQMARDFHARLDRMQRVLLQLLAEEAGVDAGIPAPEQDTHEGGGTATAERLRTVLYTLDPQAGQRAMSVLSRLYPRMRIDVNGDEVCTEALKSLARAADVFVFAWKVSKHQAYYCVKEMVRGPDMLAMAAGAGSSSLVQAAVERVEKGCA